MADSTSSKRYPTGAGCCLAVLALLVSQAASAGRILDYIRSYDLNDYALGLSVSASQSPYSGDSTSAFAYPYLTSFTHSAFTDDWFLLRGENIGFRYPTESGWELGAIARVQTLGFNGRDNDELKGMDQRYWTVEAGPMIGWRRLPVHFQLRSYWEVLDRHSGTTSELEISLPRRLARGYIVPSIRVSYLSDEYSRYYYGVADYEARPSRPAYEPGSAVNTWAGFALGYELTPKWLLSATIGVEFLDSAVSSSPIVDRDKLWSAGIGLAYNADMFQATDPSSDEAPRYEIRLSALRSSTDSSVVRDAANGEPGEELDLEELFGVADSNLVLQFDSIFRIAYYHRFEFGFFNLKRQSSNTIEEDIEFGDMIVPAGTETAVNTRSRIIRFAYAYSLMRDEQKEIGVSAGLSATHFKTTISVDDRQLLEQSSVKALVPTVGVFGSVALGRKWRLNADINAFALEFVRYDGYIAYANAGLDYDFGDNFKAGIGFSYYKARLEGNAPELRGVFRLYQYGPKVTLSMAF